MARKEKFLTIYDTWIFGDDVEDPDELKDPTGWYDWLSNKNTPSDQAIIDPITGGWIEPGHENYADAIETLDESELDDMGIDDDQDIDHEDDDLFDYLI